MARAATLYPTVYRSPIPSSRRPNHRLPSPNSLPIPPQTALVLHRRLHSRSQKKIQFTQALPLAIGRRSLGRSIALPSIRLIRWLVGLRRRLELDALLLTIVSVVRAELLARALRVNRRRGAGRGGAVLGRRRLVAVRRRRTGCHPTGASQRSHTIATTAARVTCKNKQSDDEDDDDDAGKNPSSPVIPSRAAVANASPSTT